MRVFNIVGSVFLFQFCLLRALSPDYTLSRATHVSCGDVFFMMMNVFPDWLMYISVMNRHKMDHEILMLKVFINYLSVRHEPLPKIE